MWCGQHLSYKDVQRDSPEPATSLEIGSGRPDQNKFELVVGQRCERVRLL